MLIWQQITDSLQHVVEGNPAGRRVHIVCAHAGLTSGQGLVSVTYAQVTYGAISPDAVVNSIATGDGGSTDTGSGTGIEKGGGYRRAILLAYNTVQQQYGHTNQPHSGLSPQHACRESRHDQSIYYD